MNLLTELQQQPTALRELIAFYRSPEGERLLRSEAPAGPVVFAGMGASYHAALIAAGRAAALGIPAQAVEAIDLLNFASPGLLRAGHTLVYISQSGKSVEVAGLLEKNAGRARVVAVTNRPASPLGERAGLVLPVFADQHYRLASKNYVNSLAALHLLVSGWAGEPLAPALDALDEAANRMEGILAQGEALGKEILAALGFTDAREPDLYLLGHGIHAATARQTALMLSEWARFPARYSGVGAFRHGFVETVTPRMTALFFTPPGQTEASALELARALAAFGVRVRRIALGEMAGLDPRADGMDEWLAPLLDVIPMQLLVDALSQARGVTPDFRFIDATRVV